MSTLDTVTGYLTNLVQTTNVRETLGLLLVAVLGIGSTALCVPRCTCPTEEFPVPGARPPHPHDGGLDD